MTTLIEKELRKAAMQGRIKEMVKSAVFFTFILTRDTQLGVGNE